jgi:putative spermidine/putrescine transport system substrate-binding protein
MPAGTMEEYMSPYRKTVVPLLAAALAMLCAGVTSNIAQAQELSVGGIYGGVWADSIREGFLKPFGEKANVQLKIEEGISGVTLAKLRQQKDNPQFDVVWMDRIVSDQAIKDGLIEPITATALTNAPDVVPEAFIKNASGQIMAVTTGYWAAGLAYNTKEVKERPASWLDLAKPVFKGRLAIYSPENAINFPIMVTLAELLGGSLNNIGPAFKFMAGLAKDKAIFFGGSPAGANLLASGEADVATLASSQVWDLQNKGLPIAYVVPKEGAVAGDIRVHIVKGTKNKALAERLVDYVIGPQAQGEIARRLLLGPVNTKTTLDPETDKKMPWGPGGSIKNLRIVDALAILENRDAWSKRWNEEVAK